MYNFMSGIVVSRKLCCVASMSCFKYSGTANVNLIEDVFVFVFFNGDVFVSLFRFEGRGYKRWLRSYEPCAIRSKCSQ